MLQRYDANWYGDLARQRLDVLKRTQPNARRTFAPIHRSRAPSPTSHDLRRRRDSATAEATKCSRKLIIERRRLDEFALEK
jgi:hypothetical protein